MRGKATTNTAAAYLFVKRVSPPVLRRSCALVHVSAPRTVPTSENLISPAIDKTAAESDHTKPQWRESVKVVNQLVSGCLPVRRSVCDTRGFSANDASCVKTRSAGAPDVRASGLFIHPTVTVSYS